MSADLTAPGIVLGTLEYISPEQIKDPTAVGPASDLYSLGCTFYHLLAGYPPFHLERGASAKIKAHIDKPAPPFPDGLQLTESILTVVHNLMEKSPERRCRSAMELAGALEAILGGRDQEARESQRHTAPYRQQAAVAIDDFRDDDCLALSQQLIEMAGVRSKLPVVVSIDTRTGRFAASVNLPMLSLPDVTRRLGSAMELISIHQGRLAFLRKIQADERYFMFDMQPEIEQRWPRLQSSSKRSARRSR